MKLFRALYIAIVAVLVVLSVPTLVLADTESLYPDGVTLVLTELSGAYTDVDDDPDSPDGLWLIASGNNANTAVLASFPAPTGNPTVGADLQEFRVLVRQFDEGQTGTPNARIELWENGILVRAGSDTPVPDGGVVLSFTWNANEIGTANGSLVEANVVGTKTGGSPGTRNTVEVGAIEWNVDYSAGASAPTVTTQAATNVEDTTATGNGNITATGGENATTRGFEWDIDSGAPYANDVNEGGSFPTGAYTLGLTGLPTGTTIYYRAYATNSGGTGYGGEQTFLTKPAAPTAVAATDGSDTSKVVVTWTKSTGATNYRVYRDGGDASGLLGDVATYDDTGADAPTITPGTASATDGDSTAYVTLSLAGESANNGTTHTYKVVASNATGTSDDSLTDTGYRDVGALTYQWQRSAADSDAGYGNISGATTDPYNDTAAPAPSVTPGAATASDGDSSEYVTLSIAGETGNNGDGRYYQCVLNATGAIEQTSTSDRGYRGTTTLTYQWLRSSADADADFGNIDGATADPYNDTAGVVDPDGRYYYAEVSMSGAATQDTTHDRGYKSSGLEAGEEGGEAEFSMGETYRGIQALLDYTTIIGQGKPTDADFGEVFFGWSLPIWNDSANADEELHFQVRVPQWWEEDTTIFVHVHIATSGDESGNTYELQVTHDHSAPNVVEAFPVAGSYSQIIVRDIASSLTYAHYVDVFTFPIDHDPDDHEHIDDVIGFRIRNVDDGQLANLNGELIVVSAVVYFAESSSFVEGIVDSLIEDETLIGGAGMVLLALVILAMGLTVAMFVTKQMMLGFPSAMMWAILGGYAYTESATPWGDWQYFLFFAAMGMVMFCALAMYGLREKRDTIAESEMYEEGEGEGEGEDYFDEKREPDVRGAMERPLTRVEALRARAKGRRERLHKRVSVE